VSSYAVSTHTYGFIRRGSYVAMLYKAVRLYIDNVD